MNKITRLIVGAVSALALALGISVGATPQASAKVGNVHVNVVSGGKLRVYCNYNSAYYYVLTNGQSSWNYCTADHHDADAIKDTDSKRCIYVHGVSGRNGWWWIAKNDRVKIDDASTVGVHTYKKSRCGKRQWTRR